MHEMHDVKLRAPAGWQEVEIEDVSGPAIQVTWRRGLRPRLFSWPWRPLHHLVSWRLEDPAHLRWDVDDKGLHLLVSLQRYLHPEVERYRVDHDRLGSELAILLVLVAALWFAAGVI